MSNTDKLWRPVWKSEAVNEMPFGGVTVHGCAVKPDPLMLHAVVVVVLYLCMFYICIRHAICCHS